MKVRVIRSFGNHEPGEICDSHVMMSTGKTVDMEQDRKAFAHWIEVGWAEEVVEEEPVVEHVTKQRRQAIQDKAVQ